MSKITKNVSFNRADSTLSTQGDDTLSTQGNCSSDTIRNNISDIRCI